MKSTFLAAILLTGPAVLGSPHQAHDFKSSRTRSSPATVMTETLGPKSPKPTVINAPLTAWIKNESTDLQWYTTIFVGTPPQEFTVLIDTGSNMLLLPQSNCTGAGPGQRTFSPAQSSTFSWSTNASQLELFAANGTLRFGSGVDTTPLAADYGARPGEATRVRWAVDDVRIQGATAARFTFMLAHAEAALLAAMPGIDGVLGLSLAGGTRLRPADGGAAPPPLPAALHQAGLLASGVFGLDLAPRAGQLTLGGVDAARCDAGALAWVGLNRTYAPYPKAQWNVNMQTVFVDGRQLLLAAASDSDSGAKANTATATATSTTTAVPYPRSLVSVLDTGFAPIIAPDAAAARSLYAQISPRIRQIDPNGAWGCACADMAALLGGGGGEITFLLGLDGTGEAQLNVTLPGRAFNLGPYPGRRGVCQAAVNHWSGAGAFAPGGVGLWALGSVLLKHYYTAWDGDGLRVGFVPRKSAGGGSQRRRGAGRDRLDARRLEPANIGLGGALMVLDG